MMKPYEDFEKLSAYLDGELPLSEKNELEEKLAYSPELKKKLLELQKIKESVKSSYKTLPESPFFESRVMAGLKSREQAPFIRRKWVPVLGLVMVTAALMIVLKFNPSFINRILEQQGTNLAAFYKANLKPLLYAANLSNEDIFNFAFYKELPLDNKNQQFLQLGHNPNGVEYFEIKKSSYNIQENNYERFVTALNLNENQKRHVDSILQHYGAELQAQVLVNDRHTVAINPNLWNYNRAIAAEIVRFASQINEPELRKILPVSDKYLKSAEIVKMVNEIKANEDQNFILIAPDTIFTSWIDLDQKDLKEDLRKAREEYHTVRDQFKVQANEFNKEFKRYNIVVNFDSLRHYQEKNYKKDNFEVYVGDDNCRIVLQGFQAPEMEIPDIDSINAHVERMMKTVQVFTNNSPRTPSKLSRRYNFQYEFGDSLHQLEIPQMSTNDSAMRMNYDYIYQNNQRIDSLMSHYMPNFRFRQDSLTTYFKMYDDSSRSELQNQLRLMEEEMRQFREEMQKLRKDLNKEKQPKSIKKINKSIEI